MASDLISRITTSELTPLLDDETGVYLIDVREPDEVADWSISGAHNIPLDELSHSLELLPRDQRLVMVCAKGARAQEGAHILAEHGIRSSVLEGGMSAWANTYDEVEQEFHGASVVQVRRRGKGCLSYVVGSGATAIVIDPSIETDRYQEIASRHGWSVRHVLDTHLHADHLSGARELAATTGATLWLNPADPFSFSFRPLRNGELIELSPGVQLSVSSVSVPGHTEGSTMYQLGQDVVFTGDTLFLESVGRPDLADNAEAFAHSLYRSLHERVLTLPDTILVLPAHYGKNVEVRGARFVGATLGSLRESLEVLSIGEDAFVEWAVKNVKDRPPNYRSIVRINAGTENQSSASLELELGPNRCAIA